MSSCCSASIISSQPPPTLLLTCFCNISVHNCFWVKHRIRSIIIWPLIFQPRLDAPVKWSERTALTDSLSQCWFFLERIRNCMSSRAQTRSQAPSYSLSTKWHALLWTEVRVSVSSSDTLPGRCAALRGITCYLAHAGGIYWRWAFNSGVMFHPVPSGGFLQGWK